MTDALAAIILAGGRATRMDGRDKGLIPLAGRPMIAHVIDAVRPQVDALAINANRSLDAYAALGLPVLQDQLADYPGPLAGMAAGLAWCPAECLLTLPCDGPRVPADLAERLQAALGDGDVAVAHDGERLQPVHALLRRRCLPSLEAFLADGGRKIDQWYATLDTRTADLSDRQDLFVNVNTPEQLAAMTDAVTPPECGHDGPSLPLAEALARVMAALEPITGRQHLALRSALDRVLAEPITASEPVPAHDNAAMDGYAIANGSPREATLVCVGSAFAGHPYTGHLAPGECVRIMTGGVVPAGTEAVVMQEHVEATDTDIQVTHWPAPGENIRRAGEDLEAGAVVLEAGRRLTAADLGVIASMGRAEVAVLRPLRVAFFSTGDELRGLGQPLGPGEIYDSNRYTLYGMLQHLGVDMLDGGVVPDDPTALQAALAEAASQADVILTSGGVSVGEADYMGEILQRHGEAHFWSIAMKPGRPLTFGRYDQAWYFGLPGNPVSVMATFTQVVTPALRHLSGEQAEPAPRFQMVCRTPLRKKPGRQEFQRGRIVTDTDGSMQVESVGRQGSGMLRSMSAANCFIVLPADQGDVEPGDWVSVEPFGRPIR